MVAEFPSVKYISFVGMSLGGLYCRFALTSLLHGDEGHPPLPLVPLNLVTLATPHVGVRHHLPWHYELAVSAGLAGASGASSVPPLRAVRCQHSPRAGCVCRVGTHDGRQRRKRG